MQMFIHQQFEVGASSGRGEIPGDDSIVSLGRFISSTGNGDQQHATALHELAHLLGNNHNGFFDDPRNCNGNHYSVLNYLYQFKNFDPDRVRQLSTEELAAINENDLDEPNAVRQIDGTPVETQYTFLFRDPFSGNTISTETVAGVSPNDVDWNQDLDTTDTNIKLNINNFGFPGCANDIGPNRDLLPGVNDWGVQNLLHRSSTNFALGVESLNPLDPLGPESSFAFFEVATEGGTGIDPPIAATTGPYSGNEGDDIVLDSTPSSDTGGICGVTSTSGILTEVFNNCVLEAEIEFLGTPFEDFIGMRLYDLGPNEANGILDEPGVDARDGSQTPLFLKDDEFSNGDDGVFNVGFAVWDADGNGATVIDTVTITNVVPSVSVLVDFTTVNEGDTVTLSPATFFDPGIDDIDNTATIDYGDGSALVNCNNTTCLAETAGTSPVFDPLDHTAPFTVVTPRVDTTGTVTGSNLYADDTLCGVDDVCTITVTVIDKDEDGFGSGTGSNTLDILVNNVAPSVVLGTLAGATINEGDTFVGGTGSFSDPGADTWTATVDYGDGGGPQALALNPDKTFTVPAHTYTDNTGSPFTVLVTVTDDDLDFGTASVVVTVNNVAPTVSTTPASVSLNDGDTLTQSGSFSDPGADTWGATVDYGEGDGPQVLALSGNTFNLSNVYENVGVFTVTVTVTDDDLGSGQATVIVTVTNAVPVITLVDCTSCDGDDNIVFGLTSDVSVTFTDPDGDLSTVTINWGDGSADTILNNVAEGTISSSHTYAVTDIGFNPVTVTVDDGLDSDTDTSLTIGVIISFPGSDPITAPINNAKVQQGRTLPVKFIAQDSSGTPISTLIVRIFTEDVDASALPIEAIRSPTPDNNNAIFDAVSGEYKFQMETAGLTAGSGRGQEHNVIVAVYDSSTVGTGLGDAFLVFDNPIFVK